MPPTPIVPALLFAAACVCAMPAHAESCDTLRAQIDAKIRAGRVTEFTLNVVDAAATAPGRVVGTCDLGKRKIVYVAGSGNAAPAAAPASGAATPPARKPAAAVITECRDGSTPRDGICKP